MAFVVKTLTSWNEVQRFERKGWLYRGQRSALWELRTALERCCDRQGISADDRLRIESQLVREFKRAYHQYARHVPDPKATLEWLSLMQHHGAPTRLLDFTYSIYVASYFAVEMAEDDAAVWAVNGPWALQQSAALMRAANKSGADKLLQPLNEGDEDIFNELFFSGPQVCVAYPANPFRLNERLSIQKGIFLLPGTVSESFTTNLTAMPGYEDPGNALKLVIPFSLRREALRQLFQMNISRTNLFPGLDGYAQSLNVYHTVFEPIRWV
jgi:hypothetical protein